MEQNRIDPTTVLGWGVDADPSNDPTYPMRDRSGETKGGLDWQRPVLQPQTVELLQSTEHNRRTAVFGTSTPPRGVSGMIRRRAFHQSEGKWSHWLLLLLADRIDMVEGVGEDLVHGKVPNIPGEMGIRSELEHNLPGFMTKVMIGGALAVAAYAAYRGVSDKRPAHAQISSPQYRAPGPARGQEFR
jgi:hypothetical protein